MRARTTIHSLFILFIVALSGAGMAAELSLDTAKQQGLVGEQYDGYLGAVASAPAASVRVLVNEVNTKRRAEYERIARANDVALSDVEALAGQKAIQRTAAGHYVRLQGQSWMRK